MGNDKTKWIFDDDDGGVGKDPGNAFTETVGGDDEPTLYGKDADTTRLMQMAEKTEIYHAGKAGALGEAPDPSSITDPVVGWLVVVKGPGIGEAIKLGAGMNAVGRDPGQRAALPFGDTLISSEDHARIIYDDDNREFFIAHGSGKNITKVNGAMVANVLPLENFALIELSKATHARFVAFCGESFDWSEAIGTSDATG